MTEEKEMWTIDELVAMTETVQHKEIEWQGKNLRIQWCELVESEEPKMEIPDDDVPESEQTEYFKKLAGERVMAMINKGNEKEPETATITSENWSSLPTTLRWNISSIILGTAQSENFTSG
tara:strand:- start:249 stop:611 length:363 start_codon:yes stop_codon:yes gene_type:complete